MASIDFNSFNLTFEPLISKYLRVFLERPSENTLTELSFILRLVRIVLTLFLSSIKHIFSSVNDKCFKNFNPSNETLKLNFNTHNDSGRFK